MHDLQRGKRIGHLPEACSQGENETYRIGDLAREFDITLRTLRFYEDRGLIQPKREGSTRLYNAQDRARLSVILLAKRVGFALVDIQELLHIYDRADELEDVTDKLLAKFTEQLDVLRSQKAEIEDAMAQLTDTIRSLRQG